MMTVRIGKKESSQLLRDRSIENQLYGIAPEWSVFPLNSSNRRKGLAVRP